MGGHWIFPLEAEALAAHLSQIDKKMQVHEMPFVTAEGE
jgi:hypothetical protein